MSLISVLCKQINDVSSTRNEARPHLDSPLMEVAKSTFESWSGNILKVNIKLKFNLNFKIHCKPNTRTNETVSQQGTG